MKSIKLPSWTERLFGLDPVPAPPHVFSLDQEQIRYGGFHTGPQGFVFEASHEQDLIPNTFEDGVLGAPVQDASSFREQVQRFVNGIEADVTEASLVLPDTWLRLTFSEITELPRWQKDRQEVLRWKLKRLVPFRVEDLRISATEVTPFPDQEEPRRLMIGFGLEILLAEVEKAFRSAGVNLGRITNTTLALLASLEHNQAEGDLAALVAVQKDSYTLSYMHNGEPLIYRYKALVKGAGVDPQAVRRDMRLTKTFIDQYFPGQPLKHLYLAADPEDEAPWLEWLYDEFQMPPEPLAFEHFKINRTQVGPTWLQTAPLLGAASLEV